jgi:hypothetical protein
MVSGAYGWVLQEMLARTESALEALKGQLAQEGMRVQRRNPMNVVAISEGRSSRGPTRVSTYFYLRGTPSGQQDNVKLVALRVSDHPESGAYMTTADFTTISVDPQTGIAPEDGVKKAVEMARQRMRGSRPGPEGTVAPTT